MNDPYIDKKKSKALSLLIAVLLAMFALSASIAVPILFRPFYYAHIEALDMPRKLGMSREQIKRAFDDMMDFELRGGEFGTGELAWSEDGRAHFEDCRKLFMLDLGIAAFSEAALAGAFALIRLGMLSPPLPIRGRGPSFWAGTGMGAAFSAAALLAASDFDRAFTLFHEIFFPGKTNWNFDPAKDQIILILPETFFRNCALLIAGIAALFTAAYVYAGRRKRGAR